MDVIAAHVTPTGKNGRWTDTDTLAAGQVVRDTILGDIAIHLEYAAPQLQKLVFALIGTIPAATWYVLGMAYRPA